MDAAIDHGRVIDVRRVPVHAADTAWSLRERAREAMLAQFDDMLGMIVAGKALPILHEQWGEQLFTRKHRDRVLAELQSHHPTHPALCLKPSAARSELV